MKALLFIICGTIILSSARAQTPKQGTLAVDTSIPLVMDGRTVGSMTLKAGSQIVIVKILPDGIMISQGGATPVKILRESVTPESLAAASATPTPVAVVTAPATASFAQSPASATNTEITKAAAPKDPVAIITPPQSSLFQPIDKWSPPPNFPKIKEGTTPKVISEDAVSRMIYYSKGADGATAINGQSGNQGDSGSPLSGKNILLYDTNNKPYKFFPYGRRLSNTSMYEIIDQGVRKMVFYKICEGHRGYGSDQVTMHYIERIIPLGEDLKLTGVHDQSLIVSDGNKSFFVTNRYPDYEGREISYSPDGSANMPGLPPQGVSNIVTSDFAAESSNNKLTITKYLGHSISVNIPATINDMPVIAIGSHAFENSKINSIMLPNSVTSIGDHAFYDCVSINSITLPANLISIGDNAFGYCYGLTSVTIPSSVFSIGNYAFEACYNLKSVSIPSSVTSIGNQAFTGCGLTSIAIPNSVTNIGGGAFSDCPLTSIALDQNNPVYSISPDGVLFNKEMTKLMIYPVSKPGSVYTIPKGVTEIGNNAFDGCKNLIRIIIPETVISIGNSSFVKCRNMTDVMMSNSVTSIGVQAFQCCDRLASVTIPSSVISIGERAFFECKKLKSVVFEGNAPTMGREVFLTTAPDFKVTYHNGAVGFSSPTWTDVSGGNWPAKEDAVKK